jgi:Uma2 family endonuclease
MEQVKRRITQMDLQRLEAEGKSVEVDDGEIIVSEGGVTFLHVIIIQNLYDVFKPFVIVNKLGTIYMDGVRSILEGAAQDDLQRAFKPEYSFLRTGRIPQAFDWMGDFPGAPDLAVEVVSPGQTNPVLLRRVSRYLEAGTEEVWLIYRTRKTLYQYRHDIEAPVVINHEEPIMTPLFPDLSIPLKSLFVTQTA